MPRFARRDCVIPKIEKKILITIDDAFSSFYEVAWPYLKKNKIPFILFVSTKPIGNKGYMDWEQIKEVEKESFAHIGHHSHSHDYLVNLSKENFKNDLEGYKFLKKDNIKDIIIQGLISSRKESSSRI